MRVCPPETQLTPNCPLLSLLPWEIQNFYAQSWVESKCVSPGLQGNLGVLSLERNSTWLLSMLSDFSWAFWKSLAWGIQENQVYWDVQLHLCSVGWLLSLLGLTWPMTAPRLQRWGFSVPPAPGEMFRMPHPVPWEDLLTAVSQGSG